MERSTMGELPTRELKAEEGDDGELELDWPPHPARSGSGIATARDHGRLPPGIVPARDRARPEIAGDRGWRSLGIAASGDRGRWGSRPPGIMPARDRGRLPEIVGARERGRRRSRTYAGILKFES